ncbi:hypothetical protein ES703_118336 [subsurface metagenome]
MRVTVPTTSAQYFHLLRNQAKREKEKPLVKNSLKKDGLALGELYKQFAPRMFGVCLRYARTRMDAEDILQDGFIKVFNNLKSFRNLGSIEGWLRRIMINTAINYYKKADSHYHLNIDADNKEDNEIYDEDFFAYADETDMGWRAQLSGWKCIYNPEAVVHHLHSASSSSYSSFKAFLVERNRIWVAVKSFPVSFLILGIFYTILRYFYQALGALTGKGAAGKFTKEANKFELIKILIKANISALLGLPKMLKKRREIMKKKRISNRELYTLLKRFGIGARKIALKE